ncbi:kinase-like domain-containing protein [Rhizophagus clarus]|uniref:Kinase-like domain-containing protein n=1 Tax=Rhizophagus clarus TaxID=94130 RepID=A0A8H3KS69_9GLOM|nr:kinase-like domain-containing protein [Rhizophagus clarus]
MDQLSEKELNNRTCLQCKKLRQTNMKYCRDCHLKNCERKYGKCFECKQINTGKNWCHTCNSKRFQQNFDNWTSGNDDIDKLIQNAQLSAENHYQVLEWISFNRFNKPKYIAEGGFGKVYKASWKDGHITHWDTAYSQWSRRRESGSFVALKSLNNSQNIKLEFINEIVLHLKIHEYKMTDQIIKCYGITQEPNTKDYIMVMNYAVRGNLQNSLNNQKKKFLKQQQSITDMGLCKPANYSELESAENQIYGVLAYLAPEILRGNDYTKASDVYSFGIIMYVVISELLPYHDNAHNEFLALNICEGLRPEFNIKVPQLILHLIKRCLDADPSNRPNAKELTRILDKWLIDFSMYISDPESIKTELISQVEETEKINSNLLAKDSSLRNKIHPEAIYKSSPINFDNLPEPKNSDGYYEIYDNISTKRYTDNLLKPGNSDCLECAIVD